MLFANVEGSLHTKTEKHKLDILTSEARHFDGLIHNLYFYTFALNQIFKIH